MVRMCLSPDMWSCKSKTFINVYLWIIIILCFDFVFGEKQERLDGVWMECHVRGSDSFWSKRTVTGAVTVTRGQEARGL